MKYFHTILLLTSHTVLASHRRKVIGCEGSTVELFCEDNKVINIVRANYGRISSSICVNNINGHDSGSWSTRCIQPTSLRTVSSVCGDERSECSVSVDDGVFGDPCPHTPKYLELVYTCQHKNQRREKPAIPDWILKIKALPVTTTLATPSSTTTTEATTTKQVLREVFTERVFNINNINHNNINLPESLPLMNEDSVEEKEPVVFINQPKTEDEDEIEDSILEDNRILPAIIVTAVSVFILGVVGVYMLLHKSDKDTSSDHYTIVKSDVSSGDQYTIVKLNNSQYPQHLPQYHQYQHHQKLYQLPPVNNHIYASCKSLDGSSQNYYQIV